MSADKITPSDTPRTDKKARDHPWTTSYQVQAESPSITFVDSDFARNLERELAALREQLAERDAELAKIKGHAEAMYEDVRLAYEDLSEAGEAYRAAYPKE